MFVPTNCTSDNTMPSPYLPRIARSTRTWTNTLPYLSTKLTDHDPTRYIPTTRDRTKGDPKSSTRRKVPMSNYHHPPLCIPMIPIIPTGLSVWRYAICQSGSSPVSRVTQHGLIRSSLNSCSIRGDGGSSGTNIIKYKKDIGGKTVQRQARQCRSQTPLIDLDFFAA